MKTVTLFSTVLLSLGVSITAFAADGVITQDKSRIEQDKQNLQKDNQDLKTANEAIKADKASGNQAQLKKDRVARHEALRNRKQDLSRLKGDRHEEKHDVKNP